MSDAACHHPLPVDDLEYTNHFRGHPRQLNHMQLHELDPSIAYVLAFLVESRWRNYAPCEEGDPPQRRARRRLI